MAPLAAVFLVRFRVHQIIQFGRVGEFNLDHPGGAEWIAVDCFGGVGKSFVDCNHFTGDRGIDIRGRFNRFDGGNCGTLFYCFAFSPALISTKTTSESCSWA